jgi:hypothetical protein
VSAIWRIGARAAAYALVLHVAGCRELDAEVGPSDLDPHYFRCEVEPVLIKSCGQLACHGHTDRFFRVFGRNRLRYGLPPEKRNEPLLEGERSHNFASAAAFVDRDDPARSLLLMKPLDEKAGGSYHGGAIEYGMGDVYLDENEADFKVLAAWAKGRKADPSCTQPGEAQGGSAP